MTRSRTACVCASRATSVSARALLLQRRQRGHLVAHAGVARGVVARRQPGDVGAHVVQPAAVLLQVALDAAQLLHARLALGQPALQLLHLGRERAASLPELRHGRRLGLQLLDAVLEVAPRAEQRVELLVEGVEHRPEALAERPRARGARALRAQLLDLVALVLHVGELRAQRLALGLRLLLVAHPRRVLARVVGLRRLQLRPARLQQLLRVALELGRGGEAGATLVQPPDDVQHRARGVLQRAAPPLGRGQRVELRERGAQGRQRREALRELLQVRARAADVG
ncbi:MAG: hypothetical protein ACXW61_14755, partial [Gemmatirosa sp.]